MAEVSVDSLALGSESDGYSAEKVFEGKLSPLGTESGILPEDHSVSSDSFHDGNSPRRNSTGKPSPKPAKEKIVPHYLRASTGSCHDLCKFGRKHTFEEEEVRPWRKRNTKAQSNKLKVAINVPLEEGEREVKQTAPPQRTPSGETCGRKNAAVEKELMSPLRTKDHVVTAPLDEGKKAMVLEQTTSLDRTQNSSTMRVQMASPDRKQSPAKAALSGEKKKTTVHNKVASTDRQKSPVLAASSGEKKKAVVHVQMASPDRKLIPTAAEFSGGKKKAMMRKQMASSDREHRSSMAVSSGGEKKATIKQYTSPVRTSVSLKHRPSPATIKSEDHPETIKREVSFPSKNIKASLKDPSFHRNLKVEKRMNKSSSKRSPQVALMKQLSPSLRSFGSAEKPEKSEKTKTPKSCPDIVQRPVRAKSFLSFHTSDLYVRPKRRDNITTDKNRVVTKASSKKVSVHPVGSSSPSITRTLSWKRNKAEMRKAENENVPERTLHVVLTESVSTLSEPAADNKGVVPPLPSEEDAETEGEGEFESDEEVEREFDDSDSFEEDEDEYAYEEEVDEIVPGQKGTASNTGAKAVEGNARKIQRKGWAMSESKDPTPVKVKFRRGRIVDLQSDSTLNAPRRLRFRQRRVIDEKHVHHVSESRMETFKKKEVDGYGGGNGNGTGNGDGNVVDPNNVKVVLRHQDGQGKKDEQGLFNNVIEETASKLVESRKSKVKALVGAFETVISLQDTKPSSQTVS